jgi:hypothetical protein
VKVPANEKGHYDIWSGVREGCITFSNISGKGFV